MMKILSPLVTMLIIATSVHAQITLNQWNAMDAGERYITGNTYTNLDPNVVPGNSGAAQTWSFTTTAHEYYDTMNVSAIGWIPSQYSALYPQCNLAAHYGTNMTNFDLITSDANGVYVHGNVYLDPQFGLLNVSYQDPLEFISWPMTFGTVATDTAYSDWITPMIAGPADSIRQIVTMLVTTEGDGWGALQTSYGTYNTIRVKRTMSSIIQIAVHDTATGWSAFSFYTFDDKVYEWWTDTPGIGMPVATIYVDPVADTVTRYGIMTAYSVGVPEETDETHEISIFPNPASDHILFTGVADAQWEIVGMEGNVVKTGWMNSSTAEVNVEDLAAGMYVMRVNSGTEVRCSRFIIRR